MSSRKLSLCFFTSLILLGCDASKPKPSEEFVKENNAIASESNFEKTATTVIVNDCVSNKYYAQLTENLQLDSNAFSLEVNYDDHKESKYHVLDLPPGRAKIMYCTNEYVVVGFACGGPCYAQVFVFIEEKRPNETYGYCQRVIGDDGLIVYVKEEVFEDLVIRNLMNGREKNANINDCAELSWSPCQMDSIYLNRNKALVLEYGLSNDKTTRKIIDIGVLFEE